MTPGTVYRLFSCGHKLTEHPERLHRKLPSGKFTTLTICPICKTAEAEYIHQVRVCIDCGKVDTAVRALRGERCQPCSKRYRSKNRRYSGVDPNPMRYYQAGKRIDKPKHPTTEPMCKHRYGCLPDDNWAYLHCGDCKKYEREERETLVYDRRDFDPYEMALGEAV